MVRERDGAGDGVRTRDPELGKLVLYRLSYTRVRERFTAPGLLYTRRAIGQGAYV